MSISKGMYAAYIMRKTSKSKNSSPLSAAISNPIAVDLMYRRIKQKIKKKILRPTIPKPSALRAHFIADPPKIAETMTNISKIIFP